MTSSEFAARLISYNLGTEKMEPRLVPVGRYIYLNMFNSYADISLRFLQLRSNEKSVGSVVPVVHVGIRV
jgi:hypothetical protein